MGSNVDSFNASSVDLDSADPAQIICYLNAGGNEYNGQLGARVSALFVILILSTVATMFPYAAKRIPRFRIPVLVYLFARYFGAGVIDATAFIHLLDPAYEEIGPASCVGMTGNWVVYSWPPALVLLSIIIIFLLDLASNHYVECKYGRQQEINVERAVAHAHHTDDDAVRRAKEAELECSDTESLDQERYFQQQIAAFLVLEFGVIFHSVIIGLALGVAGDEFATLYPVLVFHQSFEGLGIGARLSAIPFGKRRLLPWLLALAYGLTTPIAIAVGLAVRNTYDPGAFTANVISGVLDSLSAGILIWTGLVELLAREFLFDPERSQDLRRVTYMVACVILGAGIMALLGKWA